MSQNILFNAQKSAADVFNTHWFPRYSPEYVQSQGGITWVYSKVCNGVDKMSEAAGSAASAVGAAGEFVLWPVLDVVYPINHINGDRRFVGVPRGVEQMLGDCLYPLITWGMRETNELVPGKEQRIADKVEGVLERLKGANKELLNPKGETAFDYRVKTIASSQVNAFAVPAGGMVVFTQIVKEIDGAVRSGVIKETTVEFADGSKAKVDLSGVTTEDVLAALMGHEMTHVASRHSIVALVGSFIRKAILSLGSVALATYLKTLDQEYQDISSKPESQRTEEEKEVLLERERLYEVLDVAFAWIEEKLEAFAGLFQSRKNEYEADVTGAYFSKQAEFNPLGALYLQEVLGHGKNFIQDAMHKHLEFMYTHPYGQNRKTALFAAIQEIDPKALKGRVQWEVVQNDRYDVRANSALQFVHKNQPQ
jgi:Zn-dependent protease with chaperone function